MNNICSFDDVKFENNSLVVLDTSFALCFLGCDDYEYGSNKTVHLARRKECERLINKLSEASGMFAISIKTEEEIRNVITRNTFKKRGLDKENKIKEYKERHCEQYKSIMGQCNNDISDYLKKLRNSPIYLEDPIGNIDKDTMKLAADLQYKYDIHGFNDAIQIAIALKEEATHFATLDRDFNNVNEEGMQILVDSITYNKNTDDD